MAMKTANALTPTDEQREAASSLTAEEGVSYAHQIIGWLEHGQTEMQLRFNFGLTVSTYCSSFHLPLSRNLEKIQSFTLELKSACCRRELNESSNFLRCGRCHSSAPLTTTRISWLENDAHAVAAVVDEWLPRYLHPLDAALWASLVTASIEREARHQLPNLPKLL